MATGTVILPISGAELDATNPPGIVFVNSRRKLTFDTDTDEVCRWIFRCPQDYASAPVAKVQYAMDVATSGTLQWEVAIMAVSDGDTQDVDSDNFDTVNANSATVPGTVGYLDEISVALTNNGSLAAGDWMCVKLNRDVGVGGDAAGDAEVWNVSLEYTTS